MKRDICHTDSQCTPLLRAVALFLLCLCMMAQAKAQVIIGGNVYGGGNEGDVGEHTKVILQGGFVYGSVYGGARMANVGKNAFVHIDGAHQTGNIVLKAVYGGNDIAGTIGALGNGTLGFNPKVEALNTGTFDKRIFNAFIYTTANEISDKPYVIGSLYGGGNGAYEYTSVDGGKYVVNVDGAEYTIDNKPELANTYIEIGGGFYGHVFGGGNKVTITENTVIYTENKTPFNGVVNHVCYEHAQIIDLDDRHFRRVEDGDHEDLIFDHHVAGFFGGNNLADMSIRPTWYLKEGRINNLYSGGNKGRMTHPNGIVLPLRSNDLRVNNVYGGCRIADVNPGATLPTAETILSWDFAKNEMSEYTFTEGYSSRVFITGGHFNNVYGGNDISGVVHHGSNVELHGGRAVNVYGGGNGSYAYTDNAKWVEDHPEDADFYYSIPEGSTSLQALHKHRPHAESTLLYITGYEHDNPLIVAGEVYCGGNSATLAKDGDRTQAKSTLRIGKHAIIDGVFLGSNGANMVKPDILQKYADNAFSSINLREPDQIRSYMGSVAVNIRPRLRWDEDIDETYIGSLHFGGNKGSMTFEGMTTINVPREIVIYEKVVGGCNDACVVETEYNAAYHGGLLEPGEPFNGMDNVKICLNVNAYLQPRELVLSYMDNDLFVENCEFVLDTLKRKVIETYENHTLVSPTYVDANIYGGCYTSGHVKGDVIININKPLIHPKVFEDEFARNILHATGEDVYGSAMAVYGGGYGELSVVEGNTQVNLSDEASALLVFGGGEMGVVEGNTEVNFARDMKLPTDDAYSIAHNINVYKAYAAGYAGNVNGNATLNLNGGGVLRGFGGACNADVVGTTTAIVGWRDEDGDEYNYGRPYVANAVFGGNDFGGQVYGDTLRTIQIRDYYGNSIEELQVRSQSYVQYLSGNIGKALYGGSYGSYDYTRKEIYNVPPIKDPEFTIDIAPDNKDVIASNTFVHVDSKSRDEQDIIGSATHKDPSIITGIMGGGRGYRNLPGHVEVGQTYVLLNGTDYNLRNNATPMAYRVYGGGNLSLVHHTRIDAYSGTVRQIFGGTHGVKTVEMIDTVPYNVGSTLINYYEGMIYPLTDVFGAGANSGSELSVINLYGGNVNNVHGGAYTEGYTWKSEINVPNNSTIHANAIFGGGLGEEEGRPCDVGISTLNYHSELASVELGLFGGNNNARATKESHVNVNVPVRNSNGILQSVYGAGYGNATIAGFTHIDLQEGAHVAKVYGGGKEGKVYNHYNYYFTEDEAVKDYYDKGFGHNANWSTNVSQSNTHIKIRQGAVVENNVYGGGEGVTAYVNGQTHVELLGGLVKNDIYGAGDAGDMKRMALGMNGYLASEENTQTIATCCDILGGQVRKVFGGGLNGDVEGDTHVVIGKAGSTSFYDGVPAILRNVYGGSERGLVTGLATVDMHNGYIGYEYTGGYSPVLDLDADLAVREFEDEGNVYGAGYGEGAVVINTQVNIYGGTVRNSVYGGGEIAAVGKGVVLATGDAADIETPGTTQVNMYGGLVEGDVFGGGRGYTYTFAYTGENSPYKTTREYTDGYVFGKTRVNIHRGTIGTTESLQKGKGNVFGGGNIGYVYSSGVKYTGETDKTTAKFTGHYYTDESWSERTEDCCVYISAQCVALEDLTIEGITYKKGDFVPTEALNKLGHHDVNYMDSEVDNRWEQLDDAGVIIRNAVFAGGNVSSGSDIVYANAVTVFGNVTASVIDLYNKDIVAIGGEHIGGLYGDGNLTFVDGYRELNITNYGTDYYILEKNAEITAETYNQLPEHDQHYYMLTDNNTYQLREGRILNTIQRADFCGIFGSRILLYGAQDRVPDEVDYTNYAINRVGEISLNRSQKEHGNYLGIYNVAKFFGALTSDVDFNKSVDLYKYKEDNLTSSQRNKGTSRNVLAQASGVHLELIKGLDETGEKIYGPITGLVELELIDMAVGEGGGYVYAKKEYGLQHKIPEGTTRAHLTLSEANTGAITSTAFTYDAPTGTMQTSGNFVHPERTIIDDAYSEDAHYWYVRGDYYNHNIIISAYAGSTQTFSNSTSIPFVTFENTEGNIKLDQVTTNITDLAKNEVSKSAGYVLNLAMSNPAVWNKHTPTYKCSESGIYGQHYYEKDDLVSQTIIDNHNALGENHTNDDEHAIFEPAYIATQEVTFIYNGSTHHMYAGSYIPQTMYEHNDLLAVRQHFKPAYLCVNTVKVDDKEYVLNGELISAMDFDNLKEELGNRVEIEEHFLLAHLCTKAGVFGGKKFEKDNSYSALEYVNLSATERAKFTYNYDALDLLVTDFAEDISQYGSPFCEEKVLEDAASTATVTLYVPRESNINNLSEDRTVTAVYKHTYSDGNDKRNELHYVNIHIQFKDGQPTISPLNAPKTVLPNSTIGLSLPTVTPGAYEVIGSGWEIYRNEADAISHQNGAPYVNNATPMYWYQNGYYVAYYTKTYLGRTYSNHVPLSIANYHRMGEVMNHPEFMYIDHADVDRAAKIYLDAADYESTSIAAGKGEKNDLDYFYDLYTTTLDESKLDQRVKGGHNLEFILRSDIAPNVYSNWTSIGTNENCFAGTLHGNGYTISGLNNSLFGRLCGSVYNLGVTGSFTGGGVADNGGDASDGYAENCWVYTSATPIGNAVIGQGGTTKNSYYRKDNGFKGGAIAKERTAFEMGEVAYLLNGFYLDKRYTSQGNTQEEYNATGYVEKYFADGDFRYAQGKVTMTTDERYDEVAKRYTPIYPDDYIHFGQRITYAMTEKEASDKGLDLHNSFPTHIMKSENDGQVRIVRSHGNRVYRAPAYRQSKAIDKIYFNSYAHFVDFCSEQPIHNNVTAIDFTGYQDYDYTDAANGYHPYLDYEGIEHYTISGLTSNLLIYADPVGDAASYSLFEKLYVPVLVYGKNNGSGYVNEYNELSVQLNLNQVHGHLVDLVIDGEGNRSYFAKRDQILVDKEDYNAPIAYTFDDNCYMWYQRRPDYYAEGDGNGWDALCLPFNAVLTTTQDKGQITHFYGDNTTNNEYWLRKLHEITLNEGAHAMFRRPDAVEGQSLVVENTFLYDYYYNKFNDANDDLYQKYYSQKVREKDGYPFIEAYTPYIVAFPGKNYYEFDMSGQFVPTNTGGEIAMLNPQVVTFVSKEKEYIRVTDDALVEQTTKIGNYNYTGALVNRVRTDEYVLNNVGGSFQNETGSIIPFRAYMSMPARGAPRRILIGSATEEEDPIEDIAHRGLTIYGKKEAIYIESTLEYETTVTIYSISGQVVSRVKVMPMGKEVVTVPSCGVYIANNRKVAVL